MILTYDKENKWWTFESASSVYFYDEGADESTKIRNLVAEFPDFLQQHIKLTKPMLKIEEERFFKTNDKVRICRWVRFLVIER